MKINFVTEKKPGWVLRWISESYSKYIPNSAVSEEADLDADVNIYVNYALFKQKTKCDIGYFTHKEKEGEFVEVFEDVATQVDWCIAMCERTAELLPLNKTSVHLVPPDPQFMKEKIVFGISGTEKSSGRKRYAWVEELRKIEGIEILMTNGKYEWHELPDFYKQIDYLLILSDNEGGPLPLVEAIAMGIPVITTNVGFANEYTHIEFETLEDLKKIINGLVIKKNAWEKSAKEIEDLCFRLVKKDSESFIKKFIKRIK